MEAIRRAPTAYPRRDARLHAAWTQLRWNLALWLMLALAGCGRVEQVHWARDDFNQPSVKGLAFDKLYAAPNADSMRGRRLTVEVADPVRTLQADRCKIGRPIDWPEFRRELESILADQMWRTRVFSDVCAAGDERPIDDHDLTLRVALTEFHEGNKWIRFLLPLGGGSWGATRLQWEGELIDHRAAPANPADQPDSGDQRLFAFADRRLHPGGPSLGISFKPLRSQALLGEDLRWAIEELQRGLRSITGTEVAMRHRIIGRPKYRLARAGPPGE